MARKKYTDRLKKEKKDYNVMKPMITKRIRTLVHNFLPQINF